MAHADIESANVYGGAPTGGFGAGGFFPGFIGGIFGGALLGRRGLGGGGGGYGHGGIDNSLAYLVGRDNGLEAKTSDVVAATASINETTRTTGAAIVNNLNALDGKLNAGQIAMMQGFAGVDRGLCENRHANDLQFAAIQKDMALQHCAIEKHISCEGEKTRAMLVQQNENRLLDKLEAERFAHNETMRQRDLLATGNFPISTPAHVHKHHDCGHSDPVNQIAVINQNVNAIGSTVNQLAGIVQALAAAKAA